MKKLFNKEWFCLALVLLIGTAFISPVAFLGVPDGGEDFPQHLQFATAYRDAIAAGDYLPVWAAPDNYGFGSIGTRFYPPISSFSLGLIEILTGNLFDAIWLSFLFWMLTGCIGIYFWAREWLAPKYSTIAAVLYVIIPYHLLQIYQMWLYAEYVAAAILPFCFWFITRFCRGGRLVDVLLFTVFFSLLLLSHIPTTIIGSLSLAVYGLLLIDWSQYKKTFIKLFVAFFLSLAASAFHWVKIITEFDWVRVSNLQYSTGNFDPQRNLFPLFLSAGEKYLSRGLWHFDASFALTITLFLFAFVYLTTQINKAEPPDRRIFQALSLTGLFSLFMMSLPSSFVWQSISILQRVQFPWRWLSVLSGISVLMIAFAAKLLISHSKFTKKMLAYSILLPIFSIVVFDISQNILQSAPISRAAFENRLPQMLREPACSCWFTAWAKEEAFERREMVFADSRSVNIISWSPTNREFTIEEGNSTNVRVATFYYPYWQAQVNDQNVQIEADKDGSILIPVKGEKSSVKIYFQEPNYLKFTQLFSFLTWILLFAAIILTYQNRKRSSLD